ncbi:MAG: DUF2065 domain-containing protein [Gammaproteobacteria bacterium]|nr:DUF2065 domain-containing protein [Gammaproteobacteria bacterium]
MWHDFLVALALVMVIEGVLPFLNPEGMRRIMQATLKLDNRSLRVGGLVSMLLGVATLYLVN